MVSFTRLGSGIPFFAKGYLDLGICLNVHGYFL